MYVIRADEEKGGGHSSGGGGREWKRFWQEIAFQTQTVAGRGGREEKNAHPPPLVGCKLPGEKRKNTFAEGEGAKTRGERMGENKEMDEGGGCKSGARTPKRGEERKMLLPFLRTLLEALLLFPHGMGMTNIELPDFS